MGFRGASRGQSEVIGAILIFAIIVTLIGINQAFIVPDANADVEFQHNNDVQRDMVDLRSGTTEAAASNEPRSRSIALGTDYPTRFVAVNPPAPTGSFRTVSGGDISASHSDLDLSNVCGTGSDDPDTKFLRYEPNYNEYQSANPITIENTVTYRETGGNPLFNTGQFFAQDSQINIIRYVGDFEETSARTASVDLIPSETGVAEVNTDSEDLTITLPSGLESDDWERLVDNGDVDINDDGSRVEFTFSGNTEYTVRCTTVGINEQPNVDPAQPADEGTESEANQFNPTGDVVLRGSNITGSQNGTVLMELDNKHGEDVEITAARAVFYSLGGGESDPNANRDLPDTATIGGTELEIGGDLEENIQNEVQLKADESDTISVEFEGFNGTGNADGVQEGDFFVLFLEFSETNGDETITGTYFAAPLEGESNGNGNGNN
jgi:flagellin-like protein